ncbi:MAG: hypothetical protein AAGF26_12080 [Cyanobacteria bacterium P01_G01_bin.49]
MEQHEQIIYPNLPLAIYRELAAHLRQIEGIKTELIPQQSQHFDYVQSQINHLQISYPAALNSQAKERIAEILNYYGQIHGACERKILENT